MSESITVLVLILDLEIREMVQKKKGLRWCHREVKMIKDGNWKYKKVGNDRVPDHPWKSEYYYRKFGLPWT